MFRKRTALGAIVVAIIATLVSQHLTKDKDTTLSQPPIIGRNNTVLYLTDSSSGLANAHIASAFALLTTHPHIDIHWGSFRKPNIEGRLRRVSDAARLTSPSAKPIQFYASEKHGVVPTMEKIAHEGDQEFITGYGLKGGDDVRAFLELVFTAWTADDYYTIYQEAIHLIDQIDPAVVVVDGVIRPYIDAIRNKNRLYAIVNPNALADVLAFDQPYGATFWKYPAFASGLPFPIPWSSILTNTYLQLRIMFTLGTSSRINAIRTDLAQRGIQNPLDLQLHRPEVPLLSGDLPEASLPLLHHPSNVTVCGPMVLDTAPAEQQDPELVTWMSRGRTILVCLGSNMIYDEVRATALGGALLHVLEQTDDTQILWKFNKDVVKGGFDDTIWRAPLEKYIANGRLRFESWLKVDPVSLVNTGHIDVWIHHGGANCYYEAATSGVKQVILPMWLDLYNFARIAEYLGIGIWPGKETAPHWESDALGEGFMTALQGETADEMQKKANEIKEKATKYAGRDCAGEHISRLAGLGH